MEEFIKMYDFSPAPAASQKLKLGAVLMRDTNKVLRVVGDISDMATNEESKFLAAGIDLEHRGGGAEALELPQVSGRST